MIRLRIPSRLQPPQGGVQIAAGRLLEAGQLQIADALLAVDDLHVVDAGHLDVLPANRQLARAAALGL